MSGAMAAFYFFAGMAYAMLVSLQQLLPLEAAVSLSPQGGEICPLARSRVEPMLERIGRMRDSRHHYLRDVERGRELPLDKVLCNKPKLSFLILLTAKATADKCRHRRFLLYTDPLAFLLRPYSSVDSLTLSV